MRGFSKNNNNNNSNNNDPMEMSDQYQNELNTMYEEKKQFLLEKIDEILQFLPPSSISYETLPQSEFLELCEKLKNSSLSELREFDKMPGQSSLAGLFKQLKDVLQQKNSFSQTLESFDKKYNELIQLNGKKIGIFASNMSNASAYKFKKEEYEAYGYGLQAERTIGQLILKNCIFFFNLSLEDFQRIIINLFFFIPRAVINFFNKSQNDVYVLLQTQLTDYAKLEEQEFIIGEGQDVSQIFISSLSTKMQRLQKVFKLFFATESHEERLRSIVVELDSLGSTLEVHANYFTPFRNLDASLNLDNFKVLLLRFLHLELSLIMDIGEDFLAEKNEKLSKERLPQSKKDEYFEKFKKIIDEFGKSKDWAKELYEFSFEIQKKHFEGISRNLWKFYQFQLKKDFIPYLYCHGDSSEFIYRYLDEDYFFTLPPSEIEKKLLEIMSINKKYDFVDACKFYSGSNRVVFIEKHQDEIKAENIEQLFPLLKQEEKINFYRLKVVRDFYLESDYYKDQEILYIGDVAKVLQTSVDDQITWLKENQSEINSLEKMLDILERGGLTKESRKVFLTQHLHKIQDISSIQQTFPKIPMEEKLDFLRLIRKQLKNIDSTNLFWIARQLFPKDRDELLIWLMEDFTSSDFLLKSIPLWSGSKLAFAKKYKQRISKVENLFVICGQLTSYKDKITLLKEADSIIQSCKDLSIFIRLFPKGEDCLKFLDSYLDKIQTIDDVYIIAEILKARSLEKKFLEEHSEKFKAFADVVKFFPIIKDKDYYFSFIQSINSQLEFEQESFLTVYLSLDNKPSTFSFVNFHTDRYEFAKLNLKKLKNMEDFVEYAAKLVKELKDHEQLSFAKLCQDAIITVEDICCMTSALDLESDRIQFISGYKNRLGDINTALQFKYLFSLKNFFGVILISHYERCEFLCKTEEFYKEFTQEEKFLYCASFLDYKKEQLEPKAIGENLASMIAEVADDKRLSLIQPVKTKVEFSQNSFLEIYKQLSKEVSNEGISTSDRLKFINGYGEKLSRNKELIHDQQVDCDNFIIQIIQGLDSLELVRHISTVCEKLNVTTITYPFFKQIISSLQAEEEAELILTNTESDNLSSFLLDKLENIPVVEEDIFINLMKKLNTAKNRIAFIKKYGSCKLQVSTVYAAAKLLLSSEQVDASNSSEKCVLDFVLEHQGSINTIEDIAKFTNLFSDEVSYEFLIQLSDKIKTIDEALTLVEQIQIEGKKISNGWLNFQYNFIENYFDGIETIDHVLKIFDIIPPDKHCAFAKSIQKIGKESIRYDDIFAIAQKLSSKKEENSNSFRYYFLTFHSDKVQSLNIFLEYLKLLEEEQLEYISQIGGKSFITSTPNEQFILSICNVLNSSATLPFLTTYKDKIQKIELVLNLLKFIKKEDQVIFLEQHRDKFNSLGNDNILMQVLVRQNNNFWYIKDFGRYLKKSVLLSFLEKNKEKIKEFDQINDLILACYGEDDYFSGVKALIKFIPVGSQLAFLEKYKGKFVEKNKDSLVSLLKIKEIKIECIDLLQIIPEKEKAAFAVEHLMHHVTEDQRIEFVIQVFGQFAQFEDQNSFLRLFMEKYPDVQFTEEQSDKIQSLILIPEEDAVNEPINQNNEGDNLISELEKIQDIHQRFDLFNQKLNSSSITFTDEQNLKLTLLLSEEDAQPENIVEEEGVSAEERRDCSKEETSSEEDLSEEFEEETSSEEDFSEEGISSPEEVTKGSKKRPIEQVIGTPVNFYPQSKKQKRSDGSSEPTSGFSPNNGNGTTI